MSGAYTGWQGCMRYAPKRSGYNPDIFIEKACSQAIDPYEKHGLNIP
jgi:hypothetical protein